MAQHRRVLEPLTPALTEVRAHRMRGIAHDDDRSARPHLGLVAVVQVVAQDGVRIGRSEQRRNRFRPFGVLPSEVGEFAAWGGSPSGARSVPNQ